MSARYIGPFLVVDTETTPPGIPLWKDQKTGIAIPADDPRQPHVCQFAAILAEAQETGPSIELDRINVLVRPDGEFELTPALTKIHGITTEDCERDGISRLDMVLMYESMMERAGLLCAYGIKFDTKLMRGASRRSGRPDLFGHRPVFCIQWAVTKPCAMPPTAKMTAANRNHFKTPKLQEAYRILLGKEMTGMHNAIHDVAASVELFDWLNDRGMVEVRRYEDKGPATLNIDPAQTSAMGIPTASPEDGAI